MRKIKIKNFSNADEFIRIKEKNEGPDLVERSGYVPAKKRIESLIEAGARLVESRSQYDFIGDVIDDYDDPTRAPGYDMADAFQDGLKAQQRIREIQERQKRAKEEKLKMAEDAKKAAETAQEAPQGA